ncbi:unnamed protein product [Acanthoscelides obtectus]|uniref:Uncharacterized protein n=1 Tax=Acanthoscelides obtectus TaxID=200917 RepID=A0A9P0KAQ2_ACAOB|nr:unnamed protein product [Acanthoscelides obtectus]CAK1643783.1 hypothetical protein AOBTE_LOCUS13671 [Acanthoscelides obtectus]
MLDAVPRRVVRLIAECPLTDSLGTLLPLFQRALLLRPVILGAVARCARQADPPHFGLHPSRV